MCADGGHWGARGQLSEWKKGQGRTGFGSQVAGERIKGMKSMRVFDGCEG